MKPYIVVFLFISGLGAQPTVADMSCMFCDDIAAADTAPAPEADEEPDCE